MDVRPPSTSNEKAIWRVTLLCLGDFLSPTVSTTYIHWDDLPSRALHHCKTDWKLLVKISQVHKLKEAIFKVLSEILPSKCWDARCMHSP